ncbi:MAG: SIR2 family NAD-dependent protein deacylase [Acidimicrobiales bacterium]
MTATATLDDVRSWVAASRRIVVLTGAGISTDSGIPDFRGPQGVWTRNPEAQRTSNIHDYVADSEVRKWAWRNRLASPAWTAQPNPGHLAIAALERQGRLHALVTQNIDGLHQLAGNDPANVVELHGTMREVMCLACGERGPMPPVLERLRSGDDDPHCLVPGCGGILKSATVSFGQSLVAADLDRAQQAAAKADLLLAVGSTLQVSPACWLVPIAADAGARVVIVNAEATPYDDLADAVFREPISDVLPAIVPEEGT